MIILADIRPSTAPGSCSDICLLQATGRGRCALDNRIRFGYELLHKKLSSRGFQIPTCKPFLGLPLVSYGLRCIQIMICSLVLMQGIVHADTVLLKNGNSVDGKIIKMEDDSLEFDTDFADIIFIDWEEIAGFESDRPLTLILKSNVVLPEGIGTRDGDRLIVTRIEPNGPLPMTAVKSINPATLWYRGNIALGGNKTTGNSSTQAFNLSESFLLREDRHRLQMYGKFNEGETKGQPTAQNAAGSFRYDYYLSRQIYVISDQLVEHDRFQNLNLRTTSTVGLGYDFIDNKSHSISLGGGPTLVYQDYSTSAATIDPSTTWIFTWYREFRGGDLKLYHKHQGFRDYGRSTAFRLNADQGIRVEVWNDFSLNLEYQIRYNSQPAQGRKDLDTTFIFGVSYDIES